jgi:hypothetical protein
MTPRADGYIPPCIPTRAYKVPSGPGWVHEIKHDGKGRDFPAGASGWVWEQRRRTVGSQPTARNNSAIRAFISPNSLSPSASCARVCNSFSRARRLPRISDCINVIL